MVQSHSSLQYTLLPCHRPAERTYAHPNELVYEAPELSKWMINIFNLQELKYLCRYLWSRSTGDESVHHENGATFNATEDNKFNWSFVVKI